jgi:RsiW-degrading membrane proteinase PrsW (M82 family)
MILVSIISAFVPMFIYLFFLWKLDKNEREPVYFVLRHFFYGATGAIIIGIVASKIFSFPLEYFFNNGENSFLKIVLVAPIIEELAKAALLFRTINNKNVDNLTDGLVYGGAIGLGFGMTENFLYFITFGNSIEILLPLVLMRTLFSAVMHTISTATVGGLMSLKKYSKKSRFSFSTILGLLIAMFIHFTWNFSVSFSTTFYVGIGFMILIILIFVTTFHFSLKYENKIIRKYLEDEIPKKLLLQLSSPNRFRFEWFVKPYQNRFIEITTKLAFRKHEVEISDGNNELYKEEIDILRREIFELIERDYNYKSE